MRAPARVRRPLTLLRTSTLPALAGLLAAAVTLALTVTALPAEALAWEPGAARPGAALAATAPEVPRRRGRRAPRGACPGTGRRPGPVGARTGAVAAGLERLRLRRLPGTLLAGDGPLAGALAVPRRRHLHRRRPARLPAEAPEPPVGGPADPARLADAADLGRPAGVLLGLPHHDVRPARRGPPAGRPGGSRRPRGGPGAGSPVGDRALVRPRVVPRPAGPLPCVGPALPRRLDPDAAPCRLPVRGLLQRQRRHRDGRPGARPARLRPPRRRLVRLGQRPARHLARPGLAARSPLEGQPSRPPVRPRRARVVRRRPAGDRPQLRRPRLVPGPAPDPGRVRTGRRPRALPAPAPRRPRPPGGHRPLPAPPRRRAGRADAGPGGPAHPRGHPALPALGGTAPVRADRRADLARAARGRPPTGAQARVGGAGGAAPPAQPHRRAAGGGPRARPLRPGHLRRPPALPAPGRAARHRRRRRGDLAVPRPGLGCTATPRPHRAHQAPHGAKHGAKHGRARPTAATTGPRSSTGSRTTPAPVAGSTGPVVTERGVSRRPAAGRRGRCAPPTRPPGRRRPRRPRRSSPTASAIQVAASVSTTAGGVPRVCRVPSTH